MNLVLELVPTLLRNSFAKSRLVLIGQGGGFSTSIKPTLTIDFNLKSENKPTETILLKLVKGILLLTCVFSMIVTLVLIIPDYYYRFFPADVTPIEALAEGVIEPEINIKPEINLEKSFLPPKNENLPDGNWLVIPRIGVRTKLQVTQDPTEALQKGVWMAPDYGQPGDEYDLPIILAAHRFGWDWWWQTDYWKYHSFYNLPEIEPGDLIEVIADKRKWVYEVYAGAEGPEITDYDADIILYTCKFLNSPLRHFRYARLINLDQNTQG